MKSLRIDTVLNYIRRLNIRNNKKLIIYLICVFIATSFWLLNALSKSYVVELKYKVSYTNFPNNKVLVNDPPKEFILKVNAHGFTVLRRKLSFAFSPLVFNVNEFTRYRMQESANSYFAINTSRFINDLSEQISNEMKIIEINPDTLFFQFDRLIKKKIKVKPDVSIDLKKQYQVSGEIKIKPDSITVYGPQSILDTLKFVNTEHQKYKMASQLIQRNVSLAEIEKLRFNPKRVVMSIPVEEFTESEIQVPVRITDLPPDVKINLFPSKVKVSFLISLSRYSEIRPQDFQFNVQYKDIMEGNNRLKVNVETIPPYISSVQIAPEEVEYLIEK